MLDSNKIIFVRINFENFVYFYYVIVWVEGGKVFILLDIYKFD